MRDGGHQTSRGIARGGFKLFLIGSQVAGCCALLIIAGTAMRRFEFGRHGSMPGWNDTRGTFKIVRVPVTRTTERHHEPASDEGTRSRARFGARTDGTRSRRAARAVSRDAARMETSGKGPRFLRLGRSVRYRYNCAADVPCRRTISRFDSGLSATRFWASSVSRYNRRSRRYVGSCLCVDGELRDRVSGRRCCLVMPPSLQRHQVFDNAPGVRVARLYEGCSNLVGRDYQLRRGAERKRRASNDWFSNNAYGPRP